MEAIPNILWSISLPSKLSWIIRWFGMAVCAVANLNGRFRPMILLYLFTLTTLSCGCVSRWHAENSTSDAASPTALSATHVPPDTVALEAILVRFGEEQSEQLKAIWQQADESVIEFKQRQLLDSNGMRVGLLRGELPEAVQQQMKLNRQQQGQQLLEQVGLGAEVETRRRLLSCRAGRRKELIVRHESSKPLSVITNIEGLVSGSSLEQATALIAITALPQSDGTAVLDLLPEVQYGQQRAQFVTNDMGMRQELKRQTKSWKQFKTRARLMPGQVLMIGGTHPTKALGQAFFMSEHPQHGEEYLVLLIGLAGTQLDDLFGDPMLIQQAQAMMEQP